MGVGWLDKAMFMVTGDGLSILRFCCAYLCCSVYDLLLFTVNLKITPIIIEVNLVTKPIDLRFFMFSIHTANWI